MSTLALVVGCDAYPNANANLKGAVHDALAFREWLLSPAGGVKTADLRFLVSPSPGGAAIPAGVSVDGPATRGDFADQVADLVTKRSADRLYVFFAGHGLRNDPDRPFFSRDTIAFSELRTNDPAAACVGVRDLRDTLLVGDFGEVVIALDSCRNYPFAQPFQINGFGFIQNGVNGNHEPKEFLLQATLTGGTAQGKPIPGESAGTTQGVFTTALIRGLAGVGSAKVFDETDRLGPYSVRWSTLEQYITVAMGDQRPTMSGQDSRLVFAHFPDGYFDPVKLTVTVPDAAGPVTLDALHEVPGQAQQGRVSVAGASPLTVEVPPRRQKISAASGGLSVVESFDVYDDCDLVLKLALPDAVAPSGQPGIITRGTESGLRETVITSADPNAVVAVENLAGRRIATGVGYLSTALPAGSYIAVLIDPVATDVRATLDVAAERTSTARVRPRRPPIAFRERASWAGYGARYLGWSSSAARLLASIGATQAELLVGGDGESAEGRDRAGTGSVLIGGPSDVQRPADINGIEVVDQPGSDDSEHDGVRRWQFAGRVTGNWASVLIAGHRIEIPVLPAAVTVVAITEKTTSVALFETEALGLRFDRQGLDDPPWVLAEHIGRMDRIQAYLAAGNPRSARLVLDEMLSDFGYWNRRHRSPVTDSLADLMARQLRTSATNSTRAENPNDHRQVNDARESDPIDGVPPAFLFATDVPLGQRGRLLGPGPWAVWLDRK